VFPAGELPVDNSKVPETPPDDTLPEAIVSEPLPALALVPDNRESAPGVFEAEPAAMTTSPPEPLDATPTTRLTEPAEPTVEAPVASTI